MATSSAVPTTTPHEYGTTQETIHQIINTAQVLEMLYDQSTVAPKQWHVVVIRNSDNPATYRGLLLAKQIGRMPSTYFQSPSSNSARQAIESLFETVCEVLYHSFISRGMVLDAQHANTRTYPGSGGLVRFRSGNAPDATVAPQDLMREP